MKNIEEMAKEYAESFRYKIESKSWYQQKIDDFTEGYKAAIKNFSND